MQRQGLRKVYDRTIEADVLICRRCRKLEAACGCAICAHCKQPTDADESLCFTCRIGGDPGPDDANDPGIVNRDRWSGRGLYS